MKVNKDRFITNVSVSRDEIKEIRLLQGKKKTMSQWYTETKADIICNGALYNTNGIPIESYMTDGKILSTSDWCTYGFGINYDGSVMFGEASPYYRDFTSAFPMLVKDSKVNVFPEVANGIKAINPRTVFSQTAEGIMLTTVDGRQEEKGLLGMIITDLALYMKSLGVIHSANLDGGGSTHLLINGETANSPCENRAVSNIVAIWLKKENGGSKVSKKICIDAGHNYSKFDTGAEGNGLREQDITFEIAKQTAELLIQSGFEVKLTRENITENLGTNLNTSLLMRTNIANSWGADLFLSIHCNSFASAQPKGTECYVYKVGNEATPLAQEIVDSIVRIAKTEKRSTPVVGRSNLAVLHKTNMPAVLVETAFISNSEDADKLKNNKEGFARAIWSSVCNYYHAPTYINVPKYSAYSDIVEMLAQDEVILHDDNLWQNIAYWESVFLGNQPVKLEYAVELLKRYHNKLNTTKI